MTSSTWPGTTSVGTVILHPYTVLQTVNCWIYSLHSTLNKNYICILLHITVQGASMSIFSTASLTVHTIEPVTISLHCNNCLAAHRSGSSMALQPTDPQAHWEFYWCSRCPVHYWHWSLMWPGSWEMRWFIWLCGNSLDMSHALHPVNLLCCGWEWKEHIFRRRGEEETGYSGLDSLLCIEAFSSLLWGSCMFCLHICNTVPGSHEASDSMLSLTTAITCLFW